MNIINKIGQYRVANWWQRNVNEIQYIAVHHTGAWHNASNSDDEAMQASFNVHVNTNGWQGLSYHFYIPKSGNVYQINDYTDITWTDTKNRNALAIVLDGNFVEGGDKPSYEQLASLENLLDQLSQEHPEFPAGQSNVLFHGEIIATECCGKNLKPHVINYRNMGIIITPKYNTNNQDMNNLHAKIDESITRLQAKNPTSYNNWPRAYGNTNKTKLGEEEFVWVEEMVDQLAWQKKEEIDKLKEKNSNLEIINYDLEQKNIILAKEKQDPVNIATSPITTTEKFSIHKFFVGSSINGSLYAGLTSLALAGIDIVMNYLNGIGGLSSTEIIFVGLIVAILQNIANAIKKL
jgi:N-acetyl-anhydromuramyl-L-alanine amidase AmpD